MTKATQVASKQNRVRKQPSTDTYMRQQAPEKDMGTKTYD